MKLKYIAAVLISLVFLSTSRALKNDSPNMTKKIGARSSMEITFEKDSSELSEDAKKNLQRFISQTGQSKKIKRIAIATWADRQLAKDVKSLNESEINLAKRRALTINAFLDLNLKAGRITNWNMAERPNEAISSFNSRLLFKDALEFPKRSQSKVRQSQLYKLRNKESEAVVYIF